MTSEAQRSTIQAMIKRHTETATATPTAARNALIREGLYTRSGELKPAFGGKKSADR